jgi:hypothetical protein
MPGRDRPAAGLGVLADRSCLVAFAAMVLSCDQGVWEHEMGYRSGGGVSFITATGVARRTGLTVADAERALCRLQAAGLAMCSPQGRAWRPDAGGLAALAG